jgi:hypothetical protein
MIDATAINALMAQVKELADSAETPHEVYQLLMYSNDIIGQRAHELVMSTSTGTRNYDWAIQVSKDSREASENAERMMNWIEDESSNV